MEKKIKQKELMLESQKNVHNSCAQNEMSSHD